MRRHAVPARLARADLATPTQPATGSGTTEKRLSISKHLLRSNQYLLGSSSQSSRDQINRGLIRLSFLSAKATKHGMPLSTRSTVSSHFAICRN